MWRTLFVHLCGQRIPADQAAAFKRKTQEPTAFFRRQIEAVKNKIAEAINDQLAAIVFSPLRYMRMAAHHHIRSGIDHPARQLALALVRAKR